MSPSGGPSASPHDDAIDWMVRMKEGPLSRREKAAFEAWRAADPAHAAAFDDIAQLAADLADLGAPRSARKRAVAGAAACAAACAAAALLFAFGGDFFMSLRADYVAGVGETRRLTLDDGSRIELDSRSAVALHFSGSQRRLTLLQGEAWFQVAPDPARPFTVEAAGGAVTALGTSFDIALAQSEARVTVVEHRVAVASGGAETIVGEGRRSAYATGMPPQPAAPADIAKLTAWRRGKLIVADEPLSAVLVTLGRYRRGLIYCLRTEICARRVSGVFALDNPLQALSEIERSLGLTAFKLSDYLIVLHD